MALKNGAVREKSRDFLPKGQVIFAVMIHLENNSPE